MNALLIPAVRACPSRVLPFLHSEVCRHGLTGKNKVTSLAAELAPALPAVRSDKGDRASLHRCAEDVSKNAWYHTILLRTMSSLGTSDERGILRDNQLDYRGWPN